MPLCEAPEAQNQWAIRSGAACSALLGRQACAAGWAKPAPRVGMTGIDGRSKKRGARPLSLKKTAFGERKDVGTCDYQVIQYPHVHQGQR